MPKRLGIIWSEALWGASPALPLFFIPPVLLFVHVSVSKPTADADDTDGLCLDSKTAGKLFVAFVTFCKPLCLGSKTEGGGMTTDGTDGHGWLSLDPK